jgi:branched-chain amino acid transport system substrate-binding protein
MTRPPVNHITRRTILAAVPSAIALGAVPAFAQKKYDTGASDTEIKVGNTNPYSGPASAYGVIGKTQAAFFNMINDQGGVNGRKITFISYDDGYSPPKTVEQVRKLVESDGVLLLFNTLGTPTNTAIHKYCNAKKIPQLFVATGATKWGDPKHFPWTMGWQPSYVTEAQVYTKYILATKPDAKIGILYQNDAFGLNYIAGLRQGLGAKASEIVDQQGFNATDTVVTQQVLALKAKGANVFFVVATPGQAIAGLVTATKIGWSPTTFLANVSNIRPILLVAASNGANLDGLISSSYLPTWNQTSIKGMLLAKSIIGKYAPDLATDFAEGDSNLVYGMAVAWTFVYALQHSGKNPTRASLEAALHSMNTAANPFVYPGIRIKTSKSDGFPIEQLVLTKWTGGTGGGMVSLGKLQTTGH